MIIIILYYKQGGSLCLLLDFFYRPFKIILSMQAKDYNRSGNYTGAKQCGYVALGCNIAVIVWYVIEIITIISILAVILSASSSGSGYYSNSGSGTFDCRSYRCCSGHNC